MGTKITEYLPKIDTKGWKSDQGTGSLVTFVLAAFLLLISIGVGLVLVINLFKDEKALQNWGVGGLALPAPVNFSDILVLGIVFIVGMIVALINVYMFNNQALQKVVRFYTWLCAITLTSVYLKIAFNFYNTSFDFADRFYKYIGACLILSLSVLVLPLIFERYRVREFAFLVFVGNFFHLLFLLVHYIFGDGVIENFFWGDIVLLLMMILIGVYLIQNAPIFVAIKREMDLFFAAKD